MYPILFELGPFTLYSYGVMLVVAFLVSVWLARRAARRLPAEFQAISAEPLLDLASTALLGGLLGGRLFYIILHWEFFAQAPWEVLAIWHGGLVWYGGFLGGVVAAWLYTRTQRLDFIRVCDQVIPFVALGHAIGRVGCFLNGCCYGHPTDAWCGVVFPGDRMPVLPTQLFEAFGLFLLFLVLRRLQEPAMLRRPFDSAQDAVPSEVEGRRPGRLLGWYLAGYAGFRFVIEFLRGDQTPWWMGFTLQQFVSLAMLMLGLWLIRRAPHSAR